MFKLSDYVDFSRINDSDYMKDKSLKSVKISNLVLIKYNKTDLNEDNVNTLGLFRSVIVDSVSNKVVSYSPPKSVNHYDFYENNSFESLSSVEEYIEGTMINVYWNERIGDWDLATKSNIGARCHYNVMIKETFRYMFLDVMNKVGLEFEDLNKDIPKIKA